jgi:hypothetical protein
MLRFIIFTFSDGVSKGFYFFRVSPTKMFYAFYVSLIVSDDRGYNWARGRERGDSAAAQDARVQEAVKWTAKMVKIEILFCGLNRF